LLQITLYTINAILPIILLILLGYLLNRFSFLTDAFVDAGNKLVFRVLLPLQLFMNIYAISSLGEIHWDLCLFTMAGIFAVFVIGFFYARRFIADPRQKGVIVQAFYRSNISIIGIPLGLALGGEAALSQLSVVTSFTVAELNILAVIALTVFLPDAGSENGIGMLVRKVAKNPLIIGLACGLAIMLIRMAEPAGADGLPVFTIKNNIPFLYKTMNYLAQSCTPVALLVLGAQFRFSAVKRLRVQIVTGVLACNVVRPFLAFLAAILLNRAGITAFGPTAFAVLVPAFAAPCAFSSGVMAREMHNDDELAAQIIVWSNFFSIFTLFIWISLLLNLGLMTFA